MHAVDSGYSRGGRHTNTHTHTHTHTHTNTDVKKEQWLPNKTQGWSVQSINVNVP